MPSPPPRVVLRKLAEGDERVERPRERLEREDLRADVHVQAGQLEAVRAAQPLDGPPRRLAS
jgi:hypothetical protein